MRENFTRARSDEQVEERVNTILEAASVVFKDIEYQKVTMAMIAEEAKFTRSNLYRYFKTREEIFLSLFLRDLENWATDVKKKINKEMDINKFVKTWVNILKKHPRLIELDAQLNVSLEKNTSESLFKNTKLKVYSLLNETLPTFKNALPEFSEQEIFDFLMFHHAMITGAWPMSQQNEMQKKALKEIGLQNMHTEFFTFYSNAIQTYLYGVLAKK